MMPHTNTPQSPHLAEVGALCGKVAEGSSWEDAMRVVAHDVVLGRVQLRRLDEVDWEKVSVVLPQG